MAKLVNTLTQMSVKTLGQMKSTLKESKFLERGVLTPEEFVESGDLLVFKCPTWEWSGGDPDRRVKYLPEDKQFLISTGVPCLTRFDPGDRDNLGIEDEDGWLAVGEIRDESSDEIVDIDGEEVIDDIEGSESSEIPDMDSFSDDNLLEEDPVIFLILFTLIL
eukprot:TRINITY_DN1495_c0_g1_i2.p1 TRINITY_DN1495_c0_g1~~TRINITY_DN1495_c0_g1_i2.p1  ORF type:complete len:163 (-),score=56.01 TRINITY_DN1495_c0_g1_i2:456-944(-)